MRRTAIFILLCLLFGVLLSVAVAWWATLKEWEDSETIGIEENGWKAGMRSTSTRTAIHAINAEAPDTMLEFRSGPTELDLFTRTLSPSWLSLPTEPASENAMVRGFGAGWPLTCVVYVQELGGESVLQEWDFVTHGGIVGTNPFDSEAEYVWSRNHLPLRVVPMGLFVDALVYGAGFAFPVLVVLLNLRLRAKHHQRHKRCPRCKYDLSRATSTVCPECGADARSLPVLISRRTVSVSSGLCAVLLFTVIGFGAAFVSQPPYSRLHHAAFVGDIEEVRDQLEAGEDIDLAAPTNDVDTWYVFTPLALAAYRGHIEIIQLLIESGADLEGQSWFGFTALHLSIEGGSNECVAMLLKAGADVNAVTDFNSDAISQTAITPEYDQELLDILLEAGYRIEPHSKQTDLAFVLALDRENDQFIHRLLELGAVPGYGALRWAVKTGRVDWLTLFVGHGADVTRIPKDVLPILYSVTPDNNPAEIIEFLIQHGQKTDTTDELGMTALMWVTIWGNPGICRIFLEFGADPNLRDDSGKNALDHAIVSGADDIEGVVLVLLDAGAEVRLVDEKGEPRFDDLDPEILKLLQEKAASKSKEKQPDQ